MKVRHFAFAMTLGAIVSKSALWDALEAQSGQTWTDRERERNVYFTKGKGDWHAGLVLTLREDRSFVEAATDASGALTLQVTQVAKGRALFDVNHFVVHAGTGRGVYQYYSQACPIGTTARFMRKIHNEVLAIASGVAKGTAPDEKGRKAAHKQHSPKNNPFSMTLLASDKAFDDLFAELAKVSAFQFDVTTLKYERPDFQPISGLVKKVHHSIKFKPKTAPSQLKSTLLAAATWDDIFKPRVEGVDFEGERLVLDFQSNKLSLLTVEFDDIAQGLATDPRQFASSKIILDLRDVAKANAALLTPAETK